MSNQALMSFAQQQFSAGENIIQAFEAFEKVGLEKRYWLLVIVSDIDHKTNALFSLSILKNPPINTSDLVISHFWPINNDLHIEDNSDAKSGRQFKISSSENSQLYFYFPDADTCKRKDVFMKSLKQIKEDHHNFECLDYHKTDETVSKTNLLETTTDNQSEEKHENSCVSSFEENVEKDERIVNNIDERANQNVDCADSEGDKQMMHPETSAESEINDFENNNPSEKDVNVWHNLREEIYALEFEHEDEYVVNVVDKHANQEEQPKNDSKDDNEIHHAHRGTPSCNEIETLDSKKIDSKKQYFEGVSNEYHQDSQDACTCSSLHIENNRRQLTFKETTIDFGIIRFNECCMREIVVTNNCQFLVEFQINGKDGFRTPISESWITVFPTQGALVPNQTLRIRIDLLVDKHSVSEMLYKTKDATSKAQIVLDGLYLNVIDGTDTYITLSGEYKSSCFGLSMETLTKLNKPVSQYDISDLMLMEYKKHGQQLMKIPRELWLLIDFLYKNGMQTPNLFTNSRKYSQSNDINLIRDWLDRWETDLFPGTPQTCAEALLLLLESTPEPICNFNENVNYAACDTFEGCRELIVCLKPLNRKIFWYICLFLRELQNIMQ